MNSAKRNLFISIFSLVICIAMLVSTTFAWFTDSVTSGINTIVAGNLDIELEYWNGTDWVPVDSSTLLFDDDARWEPGHTEVAHLHIKNAGTLSLKYKMAVNVANELSGTNVFGEEFRLSDYLVFGKVDMADASAVFQNDDTGRQQARAAVGDTAGLSTYTEADNLYAESDANKPVDGKTEKYMALVIYMPETVGNEANYMSGTTPPQIELGVSVVATQLNSENDSFGPDYDILADGSPDNTELWNAIPLTASAPKPASGEARLNAGNVGVTVPQGAIDFTDPDEEINLTVKQKDASSISVPEGTVALAFDITLEGIKDQSQISDGDEMEVTITGLPKGLIGVYIFFDDNGTMVDMGATYDPVNGTATLRTKHFSTYILSYNGAIKVYSEEDFGTLVNNYRPLIKDQTYVLMGDIAVNKILRFNDNVTLDLNGHTITNNASYWGGLAQSARVNIIDSSDAKGGKIICSNSKYLFQLARTDLEVTFSDGVIIDAAASGAAAFRILTDPYPDAKVSLIVNNAKVTGRLFLGQPYNGTTNVVFNNCEGTSVNSDVIQSNPYISAAINIVINGGTFARTGDTTILAQNANEPSCIANKFITINGATLTGTIHNKQNIIFKNGAVVNGLLKNDLGFVTAEDTVFNGTVQNANGTAPLSMTLDGCAINGLLENNNGGAYVRGTTITGATETTTVVNNGSALTLDACTITGQVYNASYRPTAVITYKNNTVVNGATMPDTEE